MTGTAAIHADIHSNTVAVECPVSLQDVCSSTATGIVTVEEVGAHLAQEEKELQHKVVSGIQSLVLDQDRTIIQRNERRQQRLCISTTLPDDRFAQCVTIPSRASGIVTNIVLGGATSSGAPEAWVISMQTLYGCIR